MIQALYLAQSSTVRSVSNSEKLYHWKRRCCSWSYRLNIFRRPILPSQMALDSIWIFLSLVPSWNVLPGIALQNLTIFRKHVQEALEADTMPTDSNALVAFIKVHAPTAPTPPKDQARRKHMPAAKANKGKRTNDKEKDNSNGKNKDKAKAKKTTDKNGNNKGKQKDNRKRKGGQEDQSKGPTKGKPSSKKGKR